MIELYCSRIIPFKINKFENLINDFVQFSIVSVYGKINTMYRTTVVKNTFDEA